MTTLTLEVHYPPADMPDADTDVLIWAEGDQEAQLGAYIGEESDGPVWSGTQGEIVTDVVAWAEMPLLQKKPAAVVGRIGREPELVPLVNGRSIDLGGRWSMPIASAPAAPALAVPLTDAARDMLAERQRQIEELGWLHDHDDEYEQGELAFAASCYAVANSGATVPPEWPWPPEWWKPRDRRRNLVRAAALLLAEIERLDRAAAAHQEKP